MKKYKISLDIHGVIDSDPNFFSFLSKAIISAGGEVHVVTGGTIERAKEEVIKYDISYTHLFSIVEYHKSIGTPTRENHPKYGFPMISDAAWDRTKADYCELHNIDLHIDDTMAYNDMFSTPFCRYWSHNNHPKNSDKPDRHLD